LGIAATKAATLVDLLDNINLSSLEVLEDVLNATPEKWAVGGAVVAIPPVS